MCISLGAREYVMKLAEMVENNAGGKHRSWADFSSCTTQAVLTEKGYVGDLSSENVRADRIRGKKEICQGDKCS